MRMLTNGYGVENVMLANTVSAVGDVVPFKSLVARIEMPSKNRWFKVSCIPTKFFMINKNIGVSPEVAAVALS